MRKSDYLKGLRTGLPVILGFVPVGIAYAIMARRAGFSAGETIFMSMTVFAGASQMMASAMAGQGAGIAAIIIATFILNLRHLIMSTCVMNRMEEKKSPLRFLAAFGVTDESFAIFTTGENRSIWSFLGLITVTYSSWNAGTIIGALASDFLPQLVTASLGIALYAMFIGILVPDLKGSGPLALLVLLTAVCNALLAQVMASSWALVLSTLVCAFAGLYFVDLPKEDEA